MKYEDFYRQLERRERKPDYKNNLIAEQFISKYIEKVCKNELLYVNP